MRRETDVIIETPNRDQGKIFHLQELDCVRTTDWADRAINVIVRNGFDLETIASHFMMGSVELLIQIGVNKLFSAPFADVKPLLDELMLCVSIQPSANAPLRRPLNDNDIDEPGTIFKLRWEVIKLHVGFSIGDVPSKASTSTSPPSASPPSHIRTSTKSSAPSLNQGRRR